MAAMPAVPTPLLILILIGLVWGTCAGPIMAMPQILPVEERASGFGVFFTTFYACVAFLPTAAGLLLDLAADPAAPLVFAAAIMASTAVNAWVFQRRGAALQPRTALST